ncbi:hypothetical protein KRX52_12380 [Pseudomonas sp. MAP12]|uniref:Uncharacterized protein n=1 Tax=Geopseudomonas aromaticivorans TaxID=2849492 RepID=A0ABS6MXP0_9GAMM|nr:hypothetical protein [Pseudomonas aromaticivorans]MBV2133589.1 hypothetical protein [Pseudomonas aromaticivorans]
MIGIVSAGNFATRRPLATPGACKASLPIADQPMSDRQDPLSAEQLARHTAAQDKAAR